jgi:glycosyltransferase involved in cell wall biosynthesis
MVTVAIDAGPLHGPRTGVGTAVAGLLGALGDRDDVTLRQYVLSARAQLADGQRRLPLPASAAVRLWSRPTPDRLRPLYSRALGRPDLVHGTNYVVPPAEVPRIVSVYDCWFLRNPDEVLPDVRRAGAALRRAVDEGAHVVTSSRATTDEVRELLDTDRVRTVHLGPPADAGTTPSSDAPGTAEHLDDLRDAADPALTEALGDAPFILSLGTGERRKNLPTLIDAFGRLAGEHGSAQLVLAGRQGDDEPAIARALARRSEATRDRIHRPGAVSDATRHWLLRNATALAYPSLDEGFGFPILEAQLVGTPVVAAAAGSIPEIAGSAALLSPPTDVEALAANLFWVLDDPAMHDKLARRGRSNVNRFSWSRTADEMLTLYRLVLEGGT